MCRTESVYERSTYGDLPIHRTELISTITRRFTEPTHGRATKRCRAACNVTSIGLTPGLRPPANSESVALTEGLGDRDLAKWRVLEVHPQSSGRLCANSTAPNSPSTTTLTIRWLRVSQTFIDVSTDSAPLPMTK